MLDFIAQWEETANEDPIVVPLKRELLRAHTAASRACQEWLRLGSTSSSFIPIRVSYELT